MFVIDAFIRLSDLAWSIGGDIIVTEFSGNRVRLVTVPGAVVYNLK